MAAEVRSLSLRARLIGTMSLLLVAIVAFGGAIASLQAQRTVEAEVASALEVAGGIVTGAVRDLDASPHPYQVLTSTVRIFDGDRHVRATLLDAGGRVVATSRVPAPDEPPPAWFAELFDETPEPVRIPLPRAYGAEAAIVLSADSRSEIVEAWQQITLGLGVLLAFFLLALAAVVVIVDGALRPLTALASPFQRIGQGDYGVRVPVGGPAEVARLSAGFNAMAERLAESEDANRRLRASVEAIQEAERAELARDLHDEIGPFLFAIDVDAGALERTAAGMPEGDAFTAAVKSRASEIRTSARRAHRRVKAVLRRLRASVVDQLGLEAAVEDLVETWRSRFPLIAFSARIDGATWGPAVDATAHSVVREAVNNALKHGLPTSIAVEIRPESDYLVVEVTDNGGGLSPKAGPTGFGLIGMGERVAALGGTLDVEDRQEVPGVRVTARIPIRTPGAGQDARETTS